MEIKNKLTEGRGRGMVGENREGLSRNMYKGPLDKAKGGSFKGGRWGWVRWEAPWGGNGDNCT